MPKKTRRPKTKPKQKKSNATKATSRRLASAKRAREKSPLRKPARKPARKPTKPTRKPGGKRPRSTADFHAKAGAARLERGLHADALIDFDRALTVDPRHLYALYGALQCVGSLAAKMTGAAREPKVNRALELSRALIARTPENSLFPYLEEHKFPRETLRAAYNALAWYGMERATSLEERNRALADIEHGLSLVSPVDDKGKLLACWDTKARILLKLGRKDEAFEIVSRTPGHSDYRDIVEESAYQEWKAGGGADKLVAPRPNESAFEALSRLAEIIEKYGDETYAALVFSRPVKDAEIAAAEKKLGVALPPSYVRFVKTHGLFKLLFEPPPAARVSARQFEDVGGARALLSPADIASETLETRGAYAEADDPETATMLADSLLFQENHYRDNFYAFRIGEAGSHGGEMSVHAFWHDDAYQWSNTWIGFEDHVKSWVQSVIDDR